MCSVLQSSIASLDMQSLQSQLVDLQDYHKPSALFAADAKSQPQCQSTNKFVSRLLPWCKVRRSKMRDSVSAVDVSTVIITKQPTKFSPKTKPRRMCDKSNAAYPVVTFVNKGDGLVSTALTGRVMVNENELYSMSAVTSSSNFSSLSNVSSSVSSKSTRISFPPSPPLRNDSLDACNQVPNWFFGSLCRDAAMAILYRKHIGAFMVRVSTSNAGSYALSIRVPNEYRISGVAHYLIVRTPKGTYKIKGFPKEFSCLHSLVVHHSISQELLPCRLNLEDCDKQIPDWFYRFICRDAALILLDRKPCGAFVVRESTTQQGCYALSLRVPDEYRVSGVAHYLIFRSAKGTFQIKGFSKEFPSLQSLIAHYSIMQELLPCPLNLTIACKAKNADRDRASRSQDSDDSEVIASCDDNNDTLLDIDSDADYQRIPSLRKRSPIVKK